MFVSSWYLWGFCVFMHLWVYAPLTDVKIILFLLSDSALDESENVCYESGVLNALVSFRRMDTQSIWGESPRIQGGSKLFRRERIGWEGEGGKGRGHEGWEKMKT